MIDKIKKGLATCSADECHGQHTDCPYHPELMCIRNICGDALALIQQLEAERDAAVDALTKIVQNHGESFCEYCDNWDRYICPPSCRTHCERFNWRGVQKEE